MKKMLTSTAKNLWVKVAAALVLSRILVLLAARLHTVRQSERGASLDTFTAHINERIPELMKAYQIPGVSIAHVKGSKILSMVLIGCLSQPYLSISSIFPRASEWLGISLFALALVMLLSSLFTKSSRIIRSSDKTMVASCRH